MLKRNYFIIRKLSHLNPFRDFVLKASIVFLKFLLTVEADYPGVKCFQIIVFVALLVGGGFMLMVWIELALCWAWEKVTDILGTKKKEDPENPAALVGSFKRYK